MAEALVSKGLATVVRYSADNDQRSSRYRDVQKLLPGRIDFFDNFSTIFGRHPLAAPYITEKGGRGRCMVSEIFTENPFTSCVNKHPWFAFTRHFLLYSAYFRPSHLQR